MKFKKTLGFLVLIAIILLATYYIYDNIHLFKDLQIVNPEYIVWMIPLLLLGLLVTGMMNSQPLRPLGVNLTKWEEFKLAIVTRFYNLITPFKGGMAARALYLKQKYKFSYTNFLATLGASYVIIFLVSSILGLISTYLIYLSSGNFSLIIFLIFLITFIGMIGIIVVSPKFKETKYSFLNRLIRVINGWHLIKNNHKVVFLTSLFSLSQLIISALLLYLQFKVFGINVSFTSTIFLSAISSLGILIAITPAGLGISEAIIVFSAATIGIGHAESLSAALLGRAVSLVVLFILGPIFSYILFKKKPQLKEENEKRNIEE